MCLDKRVQTSAPTQRGVLYIDPPDGWRYGFPKPFHIEPYDSLLNWLINNSYPKDNAEWAAANCSFFYMELDE